jgi:hypothetical protein
MRVDREGSSHTTVPQPLFSIVDRSFAQLKAFGLPFMACKAAEGALYFTPAASLRNG